LICDNAALPAAAATRLGFFADPGRQRIANDHKAMVFASRQRSDLLIAPFQLGTSQPNRDHHDSQREPAIDPESLFGSFSDQQDDSDAAAECV
jgi:hypothetical protein